MITPISRPTIKPRRVKFVESRAEISSCVWVREAYKPASEVVRFMARSVEGPVMGEEVSPSECSCSKELVGGDGDIGGVRRPLSGAMATGDAADGRLREYLT